MKKMDDFISQKIISSVLILSVFLGSCSSVKQSTSTTKTMDIYGAGVLQYPVVAELDVDINKVHGTVEQSGSSVNADQLKALAMKKAVEQNNADLLVEPTFNMVQEGNQITVTATGFPATYTNFRSITEKDLPLLEAGHLQKATVYSASKTESEQNSTSSQSPFITTILTIGGLAALSGFILLTR